MSPISTLLQSIRVQHRISQTELAERIGYEQTYISALELSKKGPPSADYIERFADELGLSDALRQQLRAAANASQRTVAIKDDVPEEVYWLLKDLRDQLPKLCARRARVLREILELATSPSSSEAEPLRTVRRRRKTEATM